MPDAQELWLSFFVGGLLGVFLYRLWSIVLTSFLGTLLLVYSGLLLLEYWPKIDALAWATKYQSYLNATVFGVTMLGLICQCLLERSLVRRQHGTTPKESSKKGSDSRKLTLLKDSPDRAA
jgi:hypothetical protein